MKCALFSGLWASSETCAVGWVGKKPLMRLRMPVWVGGGRLRIDFPGIGIVTAEDEGEHEEEAAMTVILMSNDCSTRTHRAEHSAMVRC